MLPTTEYNLRNLIITQPVPSRASFRCNASSWNLFALCSFGCHSATLTWQSAVFGDARRERLQSINFLSLDDFLALEHSENRKQSGKSFMNSRRLNEVALPHSLSQLHFSMHSMLSSNFFPICFMFVVWFATSWKLLKSSCGWFDVAAQDKRRCQGSTNIKRDYATVKRTMEACLMKLSARTPLECLLWWLIRHKAKCVCGGSGKISSLPRLYHEQCKYLVQVSRFIQYFRSLWRKNNK